MAMAAALEGIQSEDDDGNSSSSFGDDDVEGAEGLGRRGGRDLELDAGAGSEEEEEDYEVETEMVFNTDLEGVDNNYSIDDSNELESQQSNDDDVEQVDNFHDSTPTAQSDGLLPTDDIAPEVRRSSRVSQMTFHSAPEGRQEDIAAAAAALMYEPVTGLGGGSASRTRRPLSIAVPNAEGAAYSRSSTGLLSFGRRSARRSQPLNTGGLDNAIERLRNSNSEWESVAAAVAVVQESERRPTSTMSRQNQFDIGDYVLVFLTLLNVTNEEDPKDAFTVAAVNKFGFPEGEGRNEEERKGPYNFVLARVKQLHFEEDDRYYTVIREDTGSEQRADSGK